MNEEKNRVVIYTDGACSGNPGPGGWGAVLIWNGIEKELSGFEAQTTNNRMEMTAAIEALNSLKKDMPIHLYTDSEYLLKGYTQWLPNWIKKNWKDVKNKDLWERLIAAVGDKKVTWVWVRGHNGDKYNERADMLARNAIIENTK